MFRIVSLFFLIPIFGYTQENLILNGGFEEYDQCPQTTAELEFCTNIDNPIHIGSTPDFYHACNGNQSSIGLLGFQNPMEGNGMIGFGQFNNGYREYIQFKLQQELMCGSSYRFKVFVNLSNDYKYSMKNIGLYFSKEKIDTTLTFLSIYLDATIEDTSTIISDTLGWTELNFDFIADQSYQFVTLGYFRDDGDQSFIEVNSNAPFQDKITYVYIDNAELIEVNSIPIEAPNVFTPNNDGANDIFKILDNPSVNFTVEIYNRWGNLVYQFENNTGWDGNTQYDLPVAEGVYFYNIKGTGECKETIKSGFIHLFR